MADFPTVRLRPLTRDDLPLLAHWLADPLVARWWSEHAPERVEEEFGPQLDAAGPGAASEYLVVTAAGIEVPTGAWSIDYLLGEPSARGRGLGAAMAAAGVGTIWADDPTATCVIVPVHLENAGSRGALLKAGFRRLPGEVELEPDNPGDSRAHVVCRLDRIRGG